MANAPRIFISMGTPYTPELSQFRDELEGFLRDRCGADPRIIGKNEYPTGSPLTKIKEVMKKCHGVIVVAYERKFLSSGIEKRGGTAPLALADRSYTTPWNHIESSMAYSLDIPLYIICQRGLSEEGLIESKIDWYVQYMEIIPSALAQTNNTRSLEAWIADRVGPRAKQPRLLTAIHGELKLGEMTPKEIFSIGGLIIGFMTLGAAFATTLKSPVGTLLERIFK